MYVASLPNKEKGTNQETDRKKILLGTSGLSAALISSGTMKERVHEVNERVHEVNTKPKQNKNTMIHVEIVWEAEYPLAAPR